MAVEEELVAPEDSVKTGGEGLNEEAEEEEIQPEGQKEIDGLQIPQAPSPVEQGEGQQQGGVVHHGQPEM